MTMKLLLTAALAVACIAVFGGCGAPERPLTGPEKREKESAQKYFNVAEEQSRREGGSSSMTGLGSH
jgi:hypothetical protein